MTNGTKGDMYTKEILQKILDEGCWDKKPRARWEDGTPAHALSCNHGMCTYDLTKGESPLITLRPIAIQSAVGEMLWIYQKESNDLDLLRDEYNVKWWDDWDIGNRTIGESYGQTIKVHYMMKDFMKEMEEYPDSRRHLLCLWQVDDFKKPHGLKPCAFLTMWNVRHGRDGVDYLDMCLIQRSSDFCTAGCINQMQYLVFLHMIARHFGYTPGRFTWFYDNIQIYDKHMDNAKIMLEREPVDCQPEIWLSPEKTNFYDFTPDDVEIRGYSRKLIQEKNPQLKFPTAI